MREARDPAESKDPYTAGALISAARHSHDAASWPTSRIVLFETWHGSRSGKADGNGWQKPLVCSHSE